MQQITVADHTRSCNKRHQFSRRGKYKPNYGGFKEFGKTQASMDLPLKRLIKSHLVNIDYRDAIIYQVHQVCRIFRL